MDFQQILIGAVAAMWGVLVTLGTAGFRFLLVDRKELKDDIAKQRERYDAKLEASAEVIIRQNDSMQKQIDAQSAMITALQELARAAK